MSSILLLSLALGGHCAGQWAVLEQAADAVEADYVDATLAHRIAASLRDWAGDERESGECDPPAVFVDRLNRHLDAHDGHFHFERIADAAKEDDWLMAWRAKAKSTNAGVRDVCVLEGNIGYLRLTTFHAWDIAGPKLASAFRLLADTDGLVLDLRQNGGGDADTASRLLRAFLGPGQAAVQKIETRRGSRDESLPPADALRYKGPLAVLVDRRSASASEFLAYSLQSVGLAKVVGTRSAGAASLLGEPQVLGHGYQLSLPDARPVNLRTGGNWDGKGVQPDVPGGDDPLYVARRLLDPDDRP